MTFTRSVQIAKSFRPGVSISELQFYRPGTLESTSLVFNVVYSGRVTELAIFASLRTLQNIDIWIEDADGERFIILAELRLKPSEKRFDLLELIGGGTALSVSPNATLGMTLATPERRALTDEITILGYAEEVGLTTPSIPDNPYLVTDNGISVTDNGIPVVDTLTV
ncbi:MAG: hypothetical protein AAF959_09900 [Cyanobacteria bacterium P01_D01_bin.56]